MKIMGVVAEFNPFHKGHKYQLDTIKKIYKPDILVAVISNNFVQRGELGILNTKDKVNIALLMGYDVVIEIPTIISIQNAQIYCSYAVRMLEKLNCNFQVFGAEVENFSILESLIDKLKNDNILAYMRMGHSYNKACSLCLEKYNLSKYYTSNNILAMEYIRAKKEYRLNIDQKIIKRINVGYNEKNEIDDIASASYIRECIKTSKKYKHLIPYDDSKISYILDREDRIFALFKYLFFRDENGKIYDLTEEVKNYIKSRLVKAKNYEEFLKLSKSRNMSINRIKRIMLNYILKIQYMDIERLKKEDISQIKVLGINKKGAKYIKNLDFCYVNYKDIKENIKYQELLNYLDIDSSMKNCIYRGDL